MLSRTDVPVAAKSRPCTELQDEAMKYEEFVRSLRANVPNGLVMKNPGLGTSTVIWSDEERICYKRGQARLYVSLRDLYLGYSSHVGRKMSTNDLKSLAPAVFDSKLNGHNCNCTFLFLVLQTMGLTEKIQGTGRTENPFWVFLYSAKS